jgi:hypothetical protein
MMPPRGRNILFGRQAGFKAERDRFQGFRVSKFQDGKGAALVQCAISFGDEAESPTCGSLPACEVKAEKDFETLKL